MANDRRGARTRLFVITLATLLYHGTASAAVPTPEAIAAWSRYAAEADARLQRDPVPGPALPGPIGQSITVPGGTIHLWRGSVLIRQASLHHLLDQLKYPGTPPPQEDVLESRVLARTGDSLRVYLKLVRRNIVTVTYDTEHDVVFRQPSPTSASSRSTATRISQAGGGDQGFLWRLNSYWRYRQVGGDVLVELESLSLSRDVPSLVRPIVAPLVARIGRESMTRTLTALKGYIEGAPMPYH